MTILKLPTIALSLLLLAVASEAADKAKVPNEKELKALARDSLLAFSKAVAAKDFSPFVAQVSKVWRDQTTGKDLDDAFRVFIEKQIDISGVANSEPVFDPAPTIDNDGVLILRGQY